MLTASSATQDSSLSSSTPSAPDGHVGTLCVSKLRSISPTIRPHYHAAFSAECYHSLTPRAKGRPIVTATAYTRSSQNMEPRAPR